MTLAEISIADGKLEHAKNIYEDILKLAPPVELHIDQRIQELQRRSKSQEEKAIAMQIYEELRILSTRDPTGTTIGEIQSQANEMAADTKQRITQQLLQLRSLDAEFGSFVDARVRGYCGLFISSKMAHHNYRRDRGNEDFGKRWVNQVDSMHKEGLQIKEAADALK
jgi:hypothetical protein